VSRNASLGGATFSSEIDELSKLSSVAWGLCCGSDQGPRAEFVPGGFLFGVKRKGDKLESCGSFLMECSRREKTEPEAEKPLAHQREHGGLEVGWEIAGLKLHEQ